MNARAVVTVVVVTLLATGCAPSPGPSPSAPFAESPALAAASSPAASSAPVPSPTMPARPTPPPTSRIEMRATQVGAVATLLPDGRVLVAGGFDPAGQDGRDVSRWEVFDPDAEAFTAGGSMPDNLFPMAVVPLPDGRLFLPGWDGRSLLFDSARVSFERSGDRVRGRAYGGVIGLADGRVLIAGGVLSRESSGAEIFDPATGSFTVTGSMATPRSGIHMAPMGDGRILVLGDDGDGLVSTAEIFDPATGRFMPAGRLDDGQFGITTATAMADGRVLLMGQLWDASQDGAETLVGVYEPGTDRFARTGVIEGSLLGSTAALLPDGRLLVLEAAAEDLDTEGRLVPGQTHLYDPATGTFETVAVWHPYVTSTAVVLRDGRVLIVGDDGTALLYQP